MARTAHGAQPPSDKGDGGGRKRKATSPEKGKQAASASKTTRQNNPHGFDGETKELYDSLSQRTFIPTRYPDEAFLRRVGMSEDVRSLLSAGHLLLLAQTPEYSFREITLEFLSTAKVQPNGKDGNISFQLLGEQRSLTISEFARLFGFPERTFRPIDPIDPKWDGVGFFESITGVKNWNPSSTPSFHIKNPVLKYTHRVLSCGIFARAGSSNKATKADMYMLHAMLNSAPQADPAAMLAQHLARIPRTNAGIAVGGIITRIAREFGFHPNPKAKDLVPGSMTLDAKQCKSFGLCTLPPSGECLWIYPNNSKVAMPHDHVTIGNRENILWEPGSSSQPAQDTPLPDAPSSSTQAPPDDENRGATMEGLATELRRLNDRFDAFQASVNLVIEHQDTQYEELRGMLQTLLDHFIPPSPQSPPDDE